MRRRRGDPRRAAERDRRIQRGRAIRPAGPSCAGCLREIRPDELLFAVPGELGRIYCSASCFAKGRHWVDPRMCGGCYGTHPFGVRP